MKNNIIKLFPLFLILFSTACFKYDTQFDGPYKDGDETTVELPKEVVYVAGGNVYLANEFVRDSIKIDNSGTVEVASINNDHSKVLFKRPGQNIMIYDIAAENVIGEVPNSETANWFDYHKNNQTVYYILSDDKLYTNGPEVLANNPINLRTLSGVFGTVKGVVVMENGNFVFSMASLSSNNKYLFESDGINILSQYQTTSARTSFRLNASETRLWSGNELNSFLYYYRVPQLTQLGDDSQYILGAPISSSLGYRITDSNPSQILTSISQSIQSPGGQITSIDF